MQMKQKWLASVALILMMTAFLAVSGQAVASEKVVMKCVTAFSKDSPELFGQWMFVDKVEKKLGDKIRIDYLHPPWFFCESNEACLSVLTLLSPPYKHRPLNGGCFHFHERKGISGL